MASPVDSFTVREYLTAHLPNLEVLSEFVHKPPSDKPTAPAFPAALTVDEQEEVQDWQDDHSLTPALPNAEAWVDDYETFAAALVAWTFADKIARIAQYRIAFADALILNKPTTSIAADATGAGASPPGAVVTRSDA